MDYAAEIAKQGLGFLLAVVVVLGIIYLFRFYNNKLDLKEKQIDEKDKQLEVERAAHLADVKEISKDSQQANNEMANSIIAAVQKATEIAGANKSVADATFQAVQFILNNSKEK